MSAKVFLVRALLALAGICAILIAGLAGSGIAEGATVYQDGDFSYYVVKGAAVTTGYSGTDEEVTIPAVLGEYPVKTVGAWTFASDNSRCMKTLHIEEGIEAIETDALFSGSLEKLYLPSTLDLGIPDGISGIQTGVGVFDHLTSLEEIHVAANSAYLTVEDNILYNKKKTVLIKCPCMDGRQALVIPDGVIRIYDNACSGNPTLRSVQMPDSVRSIGYWAFPECWELKDINISESCEYMGQYALSGTAVESLYLPASLSSINSIGSWELDSLQSLELAVGNPYYSMENGLLFDHDKTELLYCPPFVTGDVVLPDSLKYIRIFATMHSNFDSITIPQSVSAIEDYNFTNSCTIKGFTGSFAEAYALRNGIPFESIGTVEDTVVASGSVNSRIRWSFTGTGVLTVEGQGAIPNYYETSRQAPWEKYDQKTLKIVVGDGITKIGEGAFMDSAAFEATIQGSSLLEIGAYAFLNCDSLGSINLPDSVKTIEGSAFFSSGLKRIAIPGGVESISESSFAYCGQMESIEVSAENERYAIRDKALVDLDAGKLVAFPASVSEIYTIPKGIGTIGSYAFTSSRLEKLIIPDTVNLIEKKAFENAFIRTVSIGGGVSAIPEEAFFNAYLHELYFGPNIRSVGADAFAGTAPEVFFHGTEEAWKAIKMHKTSNLSIIACSIAYNRHAWVACPDDGSIPSHTAGKKELYCTVCGMIAENKFDEQPQSIAALANAGVSFSASSVAAVSFYWQVYVNGEWVYLSANPTAQEFTLKLTATPDLDGKLFRCFIRFADDTYLYSATAVLTVHAGIERIDPEITLPASLSAVGIEAFRNTSAKSIALGDSVERIESLAFAACPNLQQVTIPGSVVEISKDAFDGCEDLVIFCEPGSCAEAFAQQSGYTYVNAY